MCLEGFSKFHAITLQCWGLRLHAHQKLDRLHFCTSLLPRLPSPSAPSATMLAGDAVAPAGSWWGGRPGLGVEPYASPQAAGAQKAAAKRLILQVRHMDCVRLGKLRGCGPAVEGVACTIAQLPGLTLRVCSCQPIA